VLNVVLFQPENPHNTGGIARTCALLEAKLHLIQPLGFAYPNRDLRRASMDYIDHVALQLHDSWTAFTATLEENANLWLFTDAGSSDHSSVRYAENDYLVFGRESDGLPPAILEAHSGVRIPMPGATRHPRADHRFHSLNVSISVGIALAEARRQLSERMSNP
jgi:tRNA (cytidine/uridine-2'-O-)-methyltransferase